MPHARLRDHFRLSPDEHAQAREVLERAVERAAANADCWAMLSWVYARLAHYRAAVDEILKGNDRPHERVATFAITDRRAGNRRWSGRTLRTQTDIPNRQSPRWWRHRLSRPTMVVVPG